MTLNIESIWLKYSPITRKPGSNFSSTIDSTFRSKWLHFSFSDYSAVATNTAQLPASGSLEAGCWDRWGPGTWGGRHRCCGERSTLPLGAEQSAPYAPPTGSPGGPRRQGRRKRKSKRSMGEMLNFFFFEGLYISKKLNIKNFKIEARIIKFLMEEEIPSSEGLGGARLLLPLKPLHTGWENTECIASLNRANTVALWMSTR